MIKAAFTGEPEPWELTEARFCETWQLLPSQIREEPADDFLRMLALLGTYHKHYNARAHTSGVSGG